MSSFTSPLIVTPLPDGRRWRLESGFEYHVGDEDSDDIISVPAGFVTDFASIPRIFWNILPPWGKYGKAAVLHDYMYAAIRHERFIHPDVEWRQLRKNADKILLEAMKVLGVGWFTRHLIYRQVRMWGWASVKPVHTTRRAKGH